jgi:histidine triad (HIT) family protein
MKGCIFCSIIKGEAPAFRVLEDDTCVAFLDIQPLFAGHVLLSPRAHYETLADVPSFLVEPLFRNAQRLQRAVEKGLGAEGSFIAINNRVSQTVPHLHIHIVPRRRKDGLRGFFWPRRPYSDEQAAFDAQQRIVAALRDGASAG